MRRIVSGAFAAIVCASSRTVSSSAAPGTTRFSNPARCASSTSKRRPVNSSSIAIARGSKRGSSTLAKFAPMPTRASGNAKYTWSAAIRRSHASAISKPPPIA